MIVLMYFETTALQTLYSFWSELMINHDNAADNDEDKKQEHEDNNKDNFRVRLVWPHKFKVSKVFKEPHQFVPNLNVM